MDAFYQTKCFQDGRAQFIDCSLYYQIRGAESGFSDSVVVLIMGAFATLRHFDELADSIMEAGYCVLSYDHRGIGKSVVQDPFKAQTSQELAADCLALLTLLFPDRKVHVYGASMGGCVAQHLAIDLRNQNRLETLFLAVTSPGSYWRMACPQWFWRLVLPIFVIKSNPREMMTSLVKKCFDQTYLNSHNHHTHQSMRDTWIEKWSSEYSDWFSFHDINITASQCSVFANHYLSPQEFSILQDCYIQGCYTTQ